MGIKYFCLVLSLSLGFVQAKADNAIEEPVDNDDFDECLVIHLRNGNKVRCGFGADDEPDITFDVMPVLDEITYRPTGENYLMVSVAYEWDKSYSFDDVDKITYELNRPESGLFVPFTLRNSIVFMPGENGIRVYGADGSPIFLYTVSGVRQPVKINKLSDYEMVDISTLVNGIYILSVGDKSYKFAKK